MLFSYPNRTKERIFEVYVVGTFSTESDVPQIQSSIQAFKFLV